MSGQSDISLQVIEVFCRIMGIKEDRKSMAPDTKLLGEIAELDSMAIVNVLTGLEEEFDIEIFDDEVSADTFISFGTLTEYIEGKMSA